jgi:hypothetical protein
MNKQTRNEGPELREVETSDLHAITGGDAPLYNEPPGCGTLTPGQRLLLGTYHPHNPPAKS